MCFQWNPPCLVILESEPTYVSKARGGQMPDPPATQNLLMPHPRDRQGRQMFRSSPGEAGRSWIYLMHKHTKKNLASIQPPWPHAWSITHVCRFTSPPSFSISDLPTLLAAGPVYSPAPGCILFHKQQVEILIFVFRVYWKYASGSPWWS